jgi:hypothetical protein
MLGYLRLTETKFVCNLAYCPWRGVEELDDADSVALAQCPQQHNVHT